MSKTSIRVVAPGIYGADGPVPVGAEFEINGPLPESWKARAQVIGGGNVTGEVIANPAPVKEPFVLTRQDGTPGTAEDIDHMDRDTLEAVAELADIKVDKRLGDEKYAAALKATLFPES